MDAINEDPCGISRNTHDVLLSQVTCYAILLPSCNLPPSVFAGLFFLGSLKRIYRQAAMSRGSLWNQSLHPFGWGKLYMNKRKFQHEILDLSVRKHACLEKSSCCPSNIQLDVVEDIRNSRKKRSTDDQIEQGSAKDSNSFSEDADSVMSASINSKNELQLHYLKICPRDKHSTSSVNWGGRFFDASVKDLETKACDEINMTNPSYNLYSFEEQQLDYGNIDEFGSSEYKTEQLEDDEALEDLFCSNGVIPNNFVLSSGRWNVNQDTEQGTENLTIDKEFEQYFSMLML